jgi:hypothetical protein
VDGPPAADRRAPFLGTCDDSLGLFGQRGCHGLDGAGVDRAVGTQGGRGARGSTRVPTARSSALRKRIDRCRQGRRDRSIRNPHRGQADFARTQGQPLARNKGRDGLAAYRAHHRASAGATPSAWESPSAGGRPPVRKGARSPG